MYANGKGVQQNYAEAGKWWIKAAEGGDLTAARHAWNLYRNGEGVRAESGDCEPMGQGDRRTGSGSAHHASAATAAPPK